MLRGPAGRFRLETAEGEWAAGASRRHKALSDKLDTPAPYDIHVDRYHQPYQASQEQNRQRKRR